MRNISDRFHRLAAREDFRTNPFRAVSIRLRTKLAPLFGGKEFSATLDGDITIEAPYTSSPGKAIRYIGVSEPETLATLRRILVPGGTFVDVGAHIGEYALISVKQMGPESRALAFEPGSEIRPYLERNVANSKYADQIKVFPFGVGEQNGEAMFTLGVDPGHSRLTAGASSLSPIPSTGEQSVTIVRLDSFLAEQSVVPTTIKIDVEGAEMQVFRGMSGLLEPERSVRPAIIFEYLERTWSVFGSTIEHLIEFLQPTGYGVYGVEGDTLSPIRSKTDADRATSHLDLDLLALLPEHVRQAGFRIQSIESTE